MKSNFISTGIILLLMACSTVKKNTMPIDLPKFDKQGHRGSRGLMPENTIPAMYKAIDLGVTTLEMDVVISKDKKVIVSHDPYFNADITTAPEGNNLSKAEGSKILLYAVDYDSIKKYDVGLKPHPGFQRQQKVAVHKPLLSDLIRSSEAYAKEKNIPLLWYNIETKSNPGGDGSHHPAPGEFVDLLIDVIQKEGIVERTVIQSFDIRTLQVVYQKYPTLKTSLLIENTDKRTLDEQLKELGFVPAVFSPHYSLVTPALVKACHDKKMKIIPWTVNTKEEIEKIKSLGVDGIITDYPDLFN
ncbi:MAG: glycerophosphodiester phosphodiesterase [Bacteroidota bacterium]|nr:glycerophosphodiester phosphodiesterase [Bacteroidota bacterium]